MVTRGTVAAEGVEGGFARVYRVLSAFEETGKLSPLKLPIWIGLLVGNVLSSFIMSFVTMPYYVNRLLKRWLRPSPEASAVKTNLAGLGIVAAVTVFWAVVFYVVTTRIWTLP